MAPSKEDIDNFIAFAPDAGEGKAFLFLESAGSVEEAVNQFYENPNKYSDFAAPSTSNNPFFARTTDNSGTDGSPDGTGGTYTAKVADGSLSKGTMGIMDTDDPDMPPDYAPPEYTPPVQTAQRRAHINPVIQAGIIRARDEQEMQNMLQAVQLANGIYNSDIEPDHDADYCNCAIHRYKLRKWNRLGVQDMWSKAVMYPGEKAYHDCYQQGMLFFKNPYASISSPYVYGSGPAGNNLAGFGSFGGYMPRPNARAYTLSLHEIIRMNTRLNDQAQVAIDEKEPRVNIFKVDQLESSLSDLSIAGSTDVSDAKGSNEKGQNDKASNNNGESVASASATTSDAGPSKPSRFAGLKKALNIKSADEKATAKKEKMISDALELRNDILAEEVGRWPDEDWRQLVTGYQEHIGMRRKIMELRSRYPLQYLHLLRAGYFEPIPVAWANQNSNPLKFSIDAAAGWRGITPAWRGYEDTAEERLYWVLNHRDGSDGPRIKPDILSALNMARDRMASAVEPPPDYFSPDDTCHLQHTSEGYSRQVMPPAFRAFDAPERSTDNTMILLDVSGSMDWDPRRPIYDEYLITGYTKTNQPRNKDVAKAIIRRFTDAMANHDHNFRGYEFTTFANEADYIGAVNHMNFESMWSNVRLGGRTRVMTGWQKVKELHFQKHSESATHHPVYGWLAGPQTPILRLLLLLDGEANDMDEFELDLLGLSWAHVTIFLIGVDGCPHHHRHANELQRISQVNHRVSFVDAQGNTPERFVTHELLKRHLGYEISMSEFEDLEQPPAYE